MGLVVALLTRGTPFHVAQKIWQAIFATIIGYSNAHAHYSIYRWARELRRRARNLAFSDSIDRHALVARIAILTGAALSRSANMRRQITVRASRPAYSSHATINICHARF